MMGYHALIDVQCCDKTDNESVNTLCTRMVELSECTELKRVSHEFEPQGFTVLLLLAESHISCHTWPERRSMCIDMFTCCPREPDWNQLTSEIQRELGGQVSLHVVYRGQPMVNAWPRRRWRDCQKKNLFLAITQLHGRFPSIRKKRWYKWRRRRSTKWRYRIGGGHQSR